MKHSLRLPVSFLLLLTSLNILIFVFRNSGFDYNKYASKNELYPGQIDSAFLKKWQKTNTYFTKEELEAGNKILNDGIGLDTISTGLNKVRAIGAWLFSSFKSQMGRPADTLNKLTPLQQYFYLSTNRMQELWCGQFQRMFGFSCTAAGFYNRYIEIVPGEDGPPDVHEVNEVFLPGMNKWIMVDVTRDRLITFRNDQPLNTAEYLDFQQQLQPDLLTVMAHDTLTNEQQKPDHYFNKKYYLRYYLDMNLPEVYGFRNKLKRYVWPDPWYVNYDPVNKHSNLLFRLKQFAALAWLISACWLIAGMARANNNNKRQNLPAAGTTS